MGFFDGLRNRVRNIFKPQRQPPSPPPRQPPPRPSPPPPSSPPPPVEYGNGDDWEWGEPFSVSGGPGEALSNKDTEFEWHLAGWKPDHGERVDLEDDPTRVLTDRELQHADYVVLWFSGPIGYQTITDSFDDWNELWDYVAGYYDEGGS